MKYHRIIWHHHVSTYNTFISVSLPKLSFCSCSANHPCSLSRTLFSHPAPAANFLDLAKTWPLPDQLPRPFLLLLLFSILQRVHLKSCLFHREGDETNTIPSLSPTPTTPFYICGRSKWWGSGQGLATLAKIQFG